MVMLGSFLIQSLCLRPSNLDSQDVLQGALRQVIYGVHMEKHHCSYSPLLSGFFHAALCFLKGETIFYILYVLKAAGHCWVFSQLSIKCLARGIIIQMDIDRRLISILPSIQGL